MQFYDITHLSAPMDKQLAQRLGYKRVLNIGTDIALRTPDSEMPVIADSMDTMNNRNVIGVVAWSSMSAAQLAKVADKNKLLIFNLNNLISKQRPQISAEMARSGRLLREAERMGVEIEAASFAESKEQILSSRQIIAWLMLLGLSESRAKLALTRLGDRV